MAYSEPSPAVGTIALQRVHRVHRLVPDYRRPQSWKLTPPHVPSVPELKSGDAFVVDAGGFTTVKLTHLNNRCESLWSEIAAQIPL